MKTEPIVPATLSVTPEGLPCSKAFDDVYQPHADPFAQARHVFLEGNGLPARWQGRERFVVLETGFGLGHNFLAFWHAWREDPARCERLVFVSIEKHPLRRDDLAAAHARSPLAPLATRLVEAWPPLTPNLHSLRFEQGRVELLLALGDVAAWLPELALSADAFCLDGFAPAKNPQMWEPRLFKAVARLAAPGATAATWTAAGAVRRALASAGFEVQRTPGIGGKRDITLARFAPTFTPRRSPSQQPRSPQRRALIVGAGLAGCATAAALARQGWQSVLIDRQPEPASETSGNAAGLFHGIVNRQDGTHARFNRAAAFFARRAVADLLAQQPDAGGLHGLLRLENDLPSAASQREMLAATGLPRDYVEALSAEEASALCALPLTQPAWFYPTGGWARPAALARHHLASAGPLCEFRGNEAVARMVRSDGCWQLLGDHDRLLAEAEVVILANAAHALHLLPANNWPLTTVRGQISMGGIPPGQPLPRVPVAGAGYLLPEVDGQMLFGATSQPGDPDPSVRAEDHASNLAQLGLLLGHPVALDVHRLQGRTGFRCVARDRLPVVGAVPDVAAIAGPSARPADQPRFVPRVEGLFVFTALGSRGITWSTLGGEVIASAVTGSPSPLESSLLDAIDPARFITRAVRHASRPQG